MSDSEFFNEQTSTEKILKEEDVSETKDHTQLTFPAEGENESIQIVKEIKKVNSKKEGFAKKIVSRFPPAIRDEVSKMIDYYEDHMSYQIKKIHQLIEQNTRLRHLCEIEDQADKENIHELKNEGQKERRIESLEIKVLEKDNKINQLNKEITELIMKVKRYKKRVYELEAKSPIKKEENSQ